MAKNWSLAEAVKVIREGKDFEAIQDLGKRFPVLAVLIAGGRFDELMQYLPEYLTANKVNGAIKKSIPDGGEDGEADEDQEPAEAAEGDEPVAEVKVKRAGNPNLGKKLEPKGEDDYENMPGKTLYSLVGKRGLKPACKGNFKKENLVAVLKANDAKPAEKSAEKPAKPAKKAEEPAEETGSADYSTMSALELFKLATKRGLKVEPKKKSAYYIDVLEKADNAQSGEDEADDGWGDDEEEEVAAKPVKAEKTAKPAKPAKPVAKAEEEEDGWDI